MKNKLFYIGMLLAVVVLAASSPFKTADPNGFIKGDPGIRSISALSFDKNGILFIGDSRSATVFALETREAWNNKAADINMAGIDEKIAAALGTQKENITITDMAVNPVSKKLYIAVQSADGTPALLKLDNNTLQAVKLSDVNFSSITLNDVYAEDAKDSRGRPMRMSTISDLAVDNGRIYVSGLSNKEFSSTFRSIAFPFTSNQQDQASLEMYHASHGRFETTSPIRTFTIGKVNGRDYLIASYTCTPLVLYPLDELKAGQHIKGRTVAEMGAGNTPIDITTITKAGETYLIMGNTARPVSDVSYKNIAAFEGTLTTQVSGKAGTIYTEIPTLTKVVQMDKLDNTRVVIMQKKENGSIDLLTAANDAL